MESKGEGREGKAELPNAGGRGIYFAKYYSWGDGGLVPGKKMKNEAVSNKMKKKVAKRKKGRGKRRKGKGGE